MLRFRVAATRSPPPAMLAVWSEEPDEAFARRFTAAGFDVTTHRLGKTRTHIVYLGRRR